ncbi:hypothetical protein GHT07_16090 [Caenimonas koreensis DSM 17982]|uniref:DUF4230 domain-containing protein n=1 Tax=Caenimonas koreensis DSM 17982 TaxID=1121255 RepID=A0A844B260_9BURK|nr:hypothetical protein [Caenimonas koreensis]MRD48808.1 hypothetical protein [Caenimonas koreensis DSM 17982]
MKYPKAVVTLAVVVVAGLAVLTFSGLRVPGTQQEQWHLLDPAQVIVLRTPGGLLEVATLSRVEEFGWQTTYTCPLIDCATLFGATVTRVRVPVHYTYRIPLAQTWELRVQGQDYVLTVPAVQPALPPAIEAAKLEIETKDAWTSPGAQLNVQSTLRQLGPELERRATLPAYLQTQEPLAARTVEEFARKWMREQGKAVNAKVRVVFRSGGA